MNTLLAFVLVYLLISISIGLYAATRVRNATDYAVAGRSLPMPVVIATVFATWFGSETVLGIPARFAEQGLSGTVEDPFGASLCLIFVGLFFARKLYRMNLLTIGDYYKQRYNRTVEVIVSLCIVASYLGWVSAQITAMGLVFSVLTGGAIPMSYGMVLGAAIVLLYTLFGGMWSVALTDAFQMLLIVGGMFFIAWVIADAAGGVGVVISHASEAGKLRFLPEMTLPSMLAFIGAGVTIMFGSIPQQDVFQRVMSSRNENIAASGAVIGGSMYFLIAFIPMFLVYASQLIDPQLFASLLEEDSQLILPTLILRDTPLIAQIMFFGALLSAIMSTASGTLLAPSVTLTENIIREMRPMNDQQLLFTTRVVVFCFTIIVTTFALMSQGMPIYEMVGNSYKVPLVGAFIPLVMGLYWKRATTQGALVSVIGGLLSWVLMEVFGAESIWPPQLVGLLVAFFGMILGSLAPQWLGQQPEHQPA
ncbi:PutP Na+/proline symporter [Oxalobacteraceae bacterium]|jgi:SSS family solute:Na+ symporter